MTPKTINGSAPRADKKTYKLSEGPNSIILSGDLTNLSALYPIHYKS